VAGARATAAAMAAVTAALATSCYATHEYREIRESPARQEPVPEPLPIHVAMVAGELRLGAAGSDVLYDARVRLCRDHFTARLSRGAPGAEAVEVGIGRKPGGTPALPAVDEKNVVDLGIGPGVAADIRLDLAAGRHRASLGGLRIAGLAVACGSGDLLIDFATPVRQSPKTMLIEAGTGRIHVRGLGNASPGTVTVHGGSGPVDIDLGGAWVRDASIEFDVRLADVVVRFPFGPGVAVRADGRDPADLVLPGFRQDRTGTWLSPGFPGNGRRIDLRIRPGIGRFEAQPSGDGEVASAPASSSLLGPRRSGITPPL
jgi:hypothetical protein